MSETTPAPAMSVDTMIENYVKLRDKKRELEDRHKQVLAPVNEAMDRLEAWLLEAMYAAGLESMKSPHGTAYKSTRTSAVVRDWTATLDYIRSQAAWDLLEARVAKTAVRARIEETEQPIPGVEVTTEVVCNVRRAGEKATGK